MTTTNQAAETSTDPEPISVETDGDTYADIRVDGTVVTSIDLIQPEKEQIQIAPFDPNQPDNALATFTVDRANDEEGR